MLKTQLMLDTNTFNRVLDGEVPIETLRRCGDLFVTSVQYAELTNTKDPVRRGELLAVFRSVPTIEKPLQTAVWGHGTWGGGQRYGQSGQHYSAVKQAIESLGGKPARSRGRSGDALIAEVCLEHRFTLVTDDRPLRTVFTEQFAGHALSFDELLSRLPDAP